MTRHGLLHRPLRAGLANPVRPAIALWLGLALSVTPVRAQEPEAAAPRGPHIAYTSPEYVTVAGSWDSLQAVVTELCEQSGIELQEYRAPDRPIRVDYQDLPLSVVLARLLREENFMVGLGGGGGAQRTSWLRVIGARDGRTVDGGGPAAAAPATAAAAGPNADFPADALGNQNAGIRREATEEYAAQLDGDLAARSRFLSTPDTTLSEQLKEAEFGKEFAALLRLKVRDAAIRGKISRVMSRLKW